MLQGSWLDPRLGQTTVKEWSVTFMHTRRNIRPTTRALYDYLLRLHILPKFGDWQLAHITAADVESWMVTLQDNEKLSPSTENKALRLLRATLTLAVRHRRLAFNPREPVESPKDKAGEMLFLTEAQVQVGSNSTRRQRIEWPATWSSGVTSSSRVRVTTSKSRRTASTRRRSC